MMQLLLLVLGLISNPANTNTTNSTDGNITTITVQNADPVDTGGEEGQTPPRK